MTKPKVPISYLRKLWSYDPETGIFTWLPRDASDFGNEGSYQLFRKRCEGRAAFPGRNNKGYPCTIVLFEGNRVNISAHVAAYAMSFGVYPSEFLDHINGDRADNRLVNLRAASRAQNSWNSRREGFVGTKKHGNKWAATMRSGGRGGRTEILGVYLTREEAHEAYKRVCNDRHGDFSPFKSTNRTAS